MLKFKDLINFNKDKYCYNCLYASDGVCCHPTEWAGEISTYFVCKYWKANEGATNDTNNL